MEASAAFLPARRLIFKSNRLGLESKMNTLDAVLCYLVIFRGRNCCQLERRLNQPTMACVFNKRIRFWLRAGSLWWLPTKSFAVWLTLKSVYLHFFHPHVNNSAMISLLITCKFGYPFVCHSRSWPVSLFSEAPNIYFFPQQTNFARKQQIPVPFALIRTTRWQNLAPRLWRGVGGWDLQFPLPDNVSCCETMWQKISTAVMAQQCSLPLHILLQELIQSPPRTYCM